jgi:hypothetical protein
MIYYMIYEMIYDMIYVFNCNLVDTLWQQYSTYLHTNSTQCGPEFGSPRLPVHPKAKIAAEIVEIRECDGHTVHKLSQWRLTADLPAPRESDCPKTRSMASYHCLISYIKATVPILEIFNMAGYFADSPRLLVRNDV